LCEHCHHSVTVAVGICCILLSQSPQLPPQILICPSTRHEGVEEERMYTTTSSEPRRYVEVNGQRHAPAALDPAKNPITHCIGG